MKDLVQSLSQRMPVITGVVLFGLLLLLYFTSLLSMWIIWGDSNTYTHGYVVFPITAYLIWRKRDQLQVTKKQPLVWPSLILFGLGMLWVVSRLLDVQVIEQFTFVAMLLVITFGLYGWPLFRVILFPLFYLFFAVPAGEALVPALMEFTADFTIHALKASGIPVYRDGMYFSIPAGDFEVAKACSGIRYLMASFSLGTLFAYLSFRSLRKQFLFSLMSLILPVFANGARAYGIVMIAHMTEMKHAVGLDHLLYGWLFFGLVMFLLFYVGNKFRDDEVEIDSASEPIIEKPEAREWVVPVLCLGLALVLPKIVLGKTLTASDSAVSLPLLPAPTGAWSGPLQPLQSYQPNFEKAAADVSARYQLRNENVHVWIYRYQPFDPEREMITETNTLVNLKDWTVMNQFIVNRRVDQGADRNADGALKTVVESHLRSGRKEYLVWYWYQFNRSSAASRIAAKTLEAWSWLRGALDLNEAIIVLAVENREIESRALIDQFANDYAIALRQCFAAEVETKHCVKVGLKND